MTMESHLNELKRRHTVLSEQIDDAKMHPSVDDLEIAALKRQKLLIKDEIEKVSSLVSMH